MSSNKSFSSETSDRYARALYELALENSELENIEKNIQDMLEIYNSSEEFKNFTKNPTKSNTDQIKILNMTPDKMNFSTTLKNFFNILVIKRRIFFLEKIFKSFLKLSATKRGEISAQLISSKILSSEDLKNIKSELSKVAGLEINFEYKIDRDLIGGFKIQLGSLMIDTSIKNKLKQYEQRMLEN